MSEGFEDLDPALQEALDPDRKAREEFEALDAQLSRAVETMNMFVDAVDPDHAQRLMARLRDGLMGEKLLCGTAVLLACLLAQETGQEVAASAERVARKGGFYSEEDQEHFECAVRQAVAMCVSLFCQTDVATLKEAVERHSDGFSGVDDE